MAGALLSAGLLLCVLALWLLQFRSLMSLGLPAVMLGGGLIAVALFPRGFA